VPGKRWCEEGVRLLITYFKSLHADLRTLLKHLVRSWRRRLGEGRHRAACATSHAAHPRRRDVRGACSTVARASESGGRYLFFPQAGFLFLRL
jgi:hypothetical protein